MKTFVAIVACFALALGFFACAKKETPKREIKQYSIEQFYKNKQIGGGAFSPDETRLLVSSNETGIYNVYEITLADGKQRQVTNSTVESFFAVDYVPRTGEILYSANKGGNEIDHIYLLGKDGAARDLTHDPKEKATFMDWSLDKSAFFYLSNKRNPKFFDLYRMDTRSWKPVMVYRNDKGYSVDGISWDQKLIALGENITTSKNRLYLYDVEGKSMTEVSDPKAPGTYGLSGFSKNNTSLFYITDAGREFRYLVRYDLKSGARSTVYETSWDVMYSYDSEHEKYRVIAVNADGRNQLKVIDLASGQEVPFPQVPDGDITGVSISPNETFMRLTVGSSKASANLSYYSFATKEVKKLTNTLNPEINPDDLVAAEVVRFKSFDSLEVPAIYYRPLTSSAET
jgi:dipeptidyl aminopeptidase/acylaminoacyl peptidase